MNMKSALYDQILKRSRTPHRLRAPGAPLVNIAYANAKYSRSDTRGRNAHIGQFISQAVAMGHRVWAWPGNEHPDVRLLPAGRLPSLLALRRMDVIYVRLQETPAAICHWALPPRRQFIGSPRMVWEFNTIPEFGLLLGHPQAAVERKIELFRRLGQGCDLAVCVSDAIAGYCREKLGIRHTLTVPNGSDPALFRPDIPPIPQVERHPQRLNVVWIGSAELAWHNFELMRAAAKILWQSPARERVAFHIIGQGWAQHPTQDAGQTNRTGQTYAQRPSQDERTQGVMPPNIHYHGPADYLAIPHWLAAMHVGLCLYHPGVADYNSPLKLFDYLASGLAVIATPQPQVCEVFAQLENAEDLIVPPDDPQTLADILLRLAGGRERVRRLGRDGRQLIIDHYNWRRAVRDTLDAIQAL
jgi:glycosyltransferase involved in cell wall biosynthesis